MPYINIRGASYHYEDTMRGKETIVFSHGLLWSGWMFRLQVEALKPFYRVITYDHRGQGRTEGTQGGYDMDSLYEDAVELITKLNNGKPVHFAGLSMGGYVGQRLAARNPRLIKSLVLLETSADEEPKENIKQYKLLNIIVKYIGFWPVQKDVLKLMFGDSFLKNPERKWEADIYLKKLRENSRRYIVKAVEGVIYRKPVLHELHKIKCPTLILVGDQDKPAPLPKSEMIQKEIPHSELKVIPNSGHTSTLEAPEFVNNAILQFLNGVMDSNDQSPNSPQSIDNVSYHVNG
ncbi:Pimeloyl-ACP methyl ester carboxylesterase [Spirosomataceae bacterium TFI 002]|nr:Pimeloyl-ACP methyl ester carboxylesterase [Spirosomataceae bacterium TFI 002]